jgi:hypothetical protein
MMISQKPQGPEQAPVPVQATLPLVATLPPVALPQVVAPLELSTPLPQVAAGKIEQNPRMPMMKVNNLIGDGGRIPIKEIELRASHERTQERQGVRWIGLSSIFHVRSER